MLYAPLHDAGERCRGRTILFLPPPQSPFRDSRLNGGVWRVIFPTSYSMHTHTVSIACLLARFPNARASIRTVSPSILSCPVPFKVSSTCRYPPSTMYRPPFRVRCFPLPSPLLKLPRASYVAPSAIDHLPSTKDGRTLKLEDGVSANIMQPVSRLGSGVCEAAGQAFAGLRGHRTVSSCLPESRGPAEDDPSLPCSHPLSSVLVFRLPAVVFRLWH